MSWDTDTLSERNDDLCDVCGASLSAGTSTADTHERARHIRCWACGNSVCARCMQMSDVMVSDTMYEPRIVCRPCAEARRFLCECCRRPAQASQARECAFCDYGMCYWCLRRRRSGNAILILCAECDDEMTTDSSEIEPMPPLEPLQEPERVTFLIVGPFPGEQVLATFSDHYTVQNMCDYMAIATAESEGPPHPIGCTATLGNRPLHPDETLASLFLTPHTAIVLHLPA